MFMEKHNYYSTVFFKQVQYYIVDKTEIYKNQMLLVEKHKRLKF